MRTQQAEVKTLKLICIAVDKKQFNINYTVIMIEVDSYLCDYKPLLN